MFETLFVLVLSTQYNVLYNPFSTLRDTPHYELVYELARNVERRIETKRNGMLLTTPYSLYPSDHFRQKH